MPNQDRSTDSHRPSRRAPLLVRDVDGVRVLTLNRPDQRNALDTGLLRSLLGALEHAARDEGVRALVLAAEGVAFCAGGDVKEFTGCADAVDLMTVRAALLAEVLLALREQPQPVVAAVHGIALGGGAALALAADLVVASPEAAFGFPEFSSSVVPSVVLPVLVDQVPPKLAFDLLTTGRRLDAEGALREGMVSRVCQPRGHLEEAIAVATGWAAVPPEIARETKRLVRNARRSSLREAMDAGLAVTAATWRQ